MAFLLGSLRGKFVLMIVLVFAGTAILTVFSFGWVGNNLAQSLGVRFAEKQVLFDQARIRAPILREVALARKLADSPVLKKWAQLEQDATLTQSALAELDSYRQSFQDKSYFFVVSKSLHYYYNDRDNQFQGRELRYTLDKNKHDDRWYFAVRDSAKSYALNVDSNAELNATNLWINTLVRSESGELLGVAGTGLDLSRFIQQFIAHGQDGVTNILINTEGAIKAHPQRSYVDLELRNQQSNPRAQLFNLLPLEHDRIAFKAAMARLKNQPESVETAFLNVEGQRQLVGLAYLPEMQWYNVTVMDPDKVITTRVFLPIVGVLAVALILSLAAVAWVLHRVVLRRIDRLDLAARKVAGGNYDVALAADGNDEMGRLATIFTRMASTIREHTQELERRVADRTAALQEANQRLAQRNQQILDSIRYAKLIQTAILPRADVLSKYLKEHLVIWLPRDVVGGDFYFLYPAGDVCYLGVVDCTGHGIPGAFMSMTAHAVIRQTLAKAGEKCPLPEILEQIDTSLRETLQHSPNSEALNYGMDIGLCRLIGNVMDYAGCGIDLFVQDTAEVRVLTATHRGLGYRHRGSVKPIQSHTITLNGSMSCYLVSDGILDQAGSVDRFGLGRERLMQFLKENRQCSLIELQTLLVEMLENHRGDMAQRDDMTVFGFSLNDI